MALQLGSSAVEQRCFILIRVHRQYSYNNYIHCYVSLSAKITLAYFVFYTLLAVMVAVLWGMFYVIRDKDNPMRTGLQSMMKDNPGKSQFTPLASDNPGRLPLVLDIIEIYVH